MCARTNPLSEHGLSLCHVCRRDAGGQGPWAGGRHARRAHTARGHGSRSRLAPGALVRRLELRTTARSTPARYVTRSALRVPPHRPAPLRAPPARAHCPRADVPFMRPRTRVAAGRSARPRGLHLWTAGGVEPCVSILEVEPLDLAAKVSARALVRRSRPPRDRYFLRFYFSTCRIWFYFHDDSGIRARSYRDVFPTPLCATTKAKRHSPAPGPAAPGVSSASNSIILSPIKPFRRGSPPSSVVSVPPCTSCTR